MKNQIVTPSSQIDSSLPLWIRSPDVVIDGTTNTSYSRENHRNFVDFMTISGESQERYGFAQNLLQNLLKYKDFNTYRNPVIPFSILKSKDNVGENDTFFEELDFNSPFIETEKLLVGKITVNDDITISETETEEIHIVDGFGFPETNGVVLIDDEVILYRRREGNVLYDLNRGCSATSILPTFRKKGEFKSETTPAKHYKGAVVYNLSVLFLTSILDRIHKTYTHGIDSSRVVPGINRDTLLKNIKDFFRSKGSKLGIKALFKILFGENDVEVFYPGDRMINPSESTWVKNLIIRTVPIPRVFCDIDENVVTPDKTIGSTVEFKSYPAVVIDGNGETSVYEPEDVFAKTYSDYAMSYQYGDETQYELYLNKDELQGKIIANPTTRLTRTLYRSESAVPNDDRRDTKTITVESTLGFPSRGVVFIDEEAIFYKNKTPNQFLDCQRGYIGVDKDHRHGSNVYGPYYVKTTITDEEGVTHTSRSWPLGLVESVDIVDSGLLHKVDDPVSLNGPGKIDYREPILASLNPPQLKTTYTFLENYDDELTEQNSSSPDEIAYVGNRTHGPDGVFFDNENVFISTSGFPKHRIGYFNENVNISISDKVGPLLKSDQILATIPRRDSIKSNKVEDDYIFSHKGTDITGVFVDGVRAYSNVSPKTITQGRIVRYEIVNKGYGYITPTITVNNRLLTENIVTSNTGEITSVTPTGNDFSYTQEPNVEVTSGRNARLIPILDPYGRIIRITIVNSGEHYYDTPTLKIVDPTGVGKGGLISCVVSGGRIVRCNIDSSGIDFQTGTSIEVIPIGAGAEVKAVVEYYELDRYSEVTSNSDWKFDDGGGFLFEKPGKNEKEVYGYVANPSLLRERLDDDGDQHSKIIGWAFDGNPIYGPFGFSNNVNSNQGVVRQQSGYRMLQSRLSVIPNGGGTLPGLNPPSQSDYPMGSFVQDYKYDPEWYSIPGDLDDTIAGYLANEDPIFLQADSDTGEPYLEITTTDGKVSIGLVVPNYVLDENNGKICNTPDFPVELYPDGVYCYFLATDYQDRPQFPYIIGKTFNNRPISQQLIIESQESISPLPRDTIYNPSIVDGIPITFDFTRVERLRNPYLESTKDGVKLQIGEVSEGSVNNVVVEDGGPLTSGIGDYCYFDNTNTTGSGAQAFVSEIKGEKVLSATGKEITTKVISHHLRLDLSNNVDFHTIADDSKLTFFNDETNAQAVVTIHYDTYQILNIDVTSSTLVQINDYSYDNKRRIFSVGDIQILPETADKTELWFEDTEHFKTGDVVTIKNGSAYDDFEPHEEALIRSIAPLTDLIPVKSNIYDIVDALFSNSDINDTLNGNGGTDSFDAGDSLSSEYPPVNKKVTLIRGYSDYKRPVDNDTEVVNTEKFLYTLEVGNDHNLLRGDVVHISGSKYPEVNGKQIICDARRSRYFSFYVKELYGEDDGVTYTTESQNAYGEVSKVHLSSGGYGYADLPVIIGLYKRQIDQAEVKINRNGGEIVSIDVLSGGSRYSNPHVIIVDLENFGSGAVATAEVSNGSVTSIKMVESGSNYVLPSVFLVESEGHYVATTDDIGKIKSMKVINPGRNISADRSLKPEIEIKTRFVVDYIRPERYSFIVVDGGTSTRIPGNILYGGNWKNHPIEDLDLLDTAFIDFKVGEILYQGSLEKQLCAAIITDYDDRRQIITVRNIKGVFKSGEPVYNHTGTTANLVVEGQADCRCVVNGSSTPEGRFIDDKSMLSREYAVIQDSYRYQWFSYVISSPLQQVDYGEFVRKIIHPAGFIQFADLTVHDSIKFVTRKRYLRRKVETPTTRSITSDTAVEMETIISTERAGMAVVGEQDLVTLFTDSCAPFVLLTGDGTPLLSSTINGPKFTLTHIEKCVDGVPFNLNN